jgi:hypothetical protein
MKSNFVATFKRKEIVKIPPPSALTLNCLAIVIRKANIGGENPLTHFRFEFQGTKISPKTK